MEMLELSESNSPKRYLTDFTGDLNNAEKQCLALCHMLDKVKFDVITGKLCNSKSPF